MTGYVCGWTCRQPEGCFEHWKAKPRIPCKGYGHWTGGSQVKNKKSARPPCCCSSISPEDNVSSTEIISSCVSLENLISGSAQHLSYLFETAIKSSQQEILDWYNYSFEFESKVDALMADGRIKDKMARSTIYKKMKPFLPTKITQANLRKKTHRARKHLMLFGKNGIGLDKIKLVSYSATEILKLTNAQIQNVIDQVKKYTSDHQSHMTLIKTVPSGNDQIKTEILDQYPNLYIENVVVKILIIMGLLMRHHAETTSAHYANQVMMMKK
ncbi:hypothetical protein C1645_744217 [Glomus cerebriforme]|uniref:Uncharacterized protein n=1 Tax=Glomus cerebriforme TaxID=658196 RepID=A0A397SAS2_9GLOM|nr:hypothetical protein C1645_744217 [Glomus cerebriforme]